MPSNCHALRHAYNSLRRTPSSASSAENCSPASRRMTARFLNSVVNTRFVRSDTLPHRIPCHSITLSQLWGAVHTCHRNSVTVIFHRNFPFPGQVGGPNKLPDWDIWEQYTYLLKPLVTDARYYQIGILSRDIPLPQAHGSPRIKIPLYRQERWEILGKHPPLTTACRQVKNGIHDLAQIRPARTPSRAPGWQQGCNQFPFVVAQIAWIRSPLRLRRLRVISAHIPCLRVSFAKLRDH